MPKNKKETFQIGDTVHFIGDNPDYRNKWGVLMDTSGDPEDPWDFNMRMNDDGQIIGVWTQMIRKGTS